MPRKFSPRIQERVRQRADFLCEYCHIDEHWQLVRFTIDHVIPVFEGGSDELENLALACFHCNRKKSNKQFYNGIQIFNPRKMQWNEHFSWSSNFLEIVAQSENGKATIELLELNRPRILQIRQDDLLVNRHPPKNDLI